jgi:hypothetical protein
LELERGCLVLEQSIVVWPHGTSWDPDERAVIFAAPFETAAAVPVGGRFRGAGGFYGRKDLGWLLGKERAIDAVACLRRTDAHGVVFAWPDSAWLWNAIPATPHARSRRAAADAAIRAIETCVKPAAIDVRVGTGLTPLESVEPPMSG